MVALVHLAIQRIEYKTVWAQLLRCYAIDTFVIFVALPAVLVLAVFVRAIERGVCNVDDKYYRGLTAGGNRCGVSGRRR